MTAKQVRLSDEAYKEMHEAAECMDTYIKGYDAGSEETMINMYKSIALTAFELFTIVKIANIIRYLPKKRG